MAVLRDAARQAVVAARVVVIGGQAVEAVAAARGEGDLRVPGGGRVASGEHVGVAVEGREGEPEGARASREAAELRVDLAVDSAVHSARAGRANGHCRGAAGAGSARRGRGVALLLCNGKVVAAGAVAVAGDVDVVHGRARDDGYGGEQAQVRAVVVVGGHALKGGAAVALEDCDNRVKAHGSVARARRDGQVASHGGIDDVPVAAVLGVDGAGDVVVLGQAVDAVVDGDRLVEGAVDRYSGLAAVVGLLDLLEDGELVLANRVAVAGDHDPVLVAVGVEGDEAAAAAVVVVPGDTRELVAVGALVDGEEGVEVGVGVAGGHIDHAACVGRDDVEVCSSVRVGGR
mmetsp:Transcript_6173/g.24896  ORF Transcript_6173/g.24896 Transcript_6173/m.24896 type:complete len:345 (+) Transcript_6173:1203-2237(+)